MALETVCPTCLRTVGVVAAPVADPAAPRRYKLPVHASQPRQHGGATRSHPRRPRCGGTGLEVAAHLLAETTLSPADRKRREVAESRGSAAGPEPAAVVVPR